MPRYFSDFSYLIFTRHVTEGIVYSVCGYKRESLDFPPNIIYILSLPSSAVISC